MPELDVPIPTTVDDDIESDGAVYNDQETQTPHLFVKNVGTMTEAEDNDTFGSRILGSEEMCKSVCGVSRWFFKMTLEQIDAALSKSRALSKIDQLVLYFTKLKQNLDFTVLAAMFHCHEKTVSSIFGLILDAHYEVAEKFTWWLSKEKVKATMPSSFKLHYPECRAIIDASEIKTCPNSVKARNLTYSNYKGNFTAKFLVAIAPSGFVMFISKAYGGRVTDCHITNNCGILEKIESGDQILADKGFPSIEEDVLNRGAFLIMPTFASGKRQFAQHENKHSYKVASVRIHVERAIQRLKTFCVLKHLDQSMFKHIDKMLVVIAYCVNHFGPLIKEKDNKN